MMDGQKEEVNLDDVWNQLELQLMILKKASVVPSHIKALLPAVIQIGDFFLSPRNRCLLIAGYCIPAPFDVDTEETMSSIETALAKLDPRDTDTRPILQTLHGVVSNRELISMQMLMDAYPKLMCQIRFPTTRLKRILADLIENRVLSEDDVERVMEAMKTKGSFQPDEISDLLKDELCTSARFKVTTYSAARETKPNMVEVGFYQVSEERCEMIDTQSKCSKCLACGPAGTQMGIDDREIPSTTSVSSRSSSSSPAFNLVYDEDEENVSGSGMQDLEPPDMSLLGIEGASIVSVQDVPQKDDDQKKLAELVKLVQASNKVVTIPLFKLFTMLEVATETGTLTAIQVDEAKKQLSNASISSADDPTRAVPLPNVLDVFARVFGTNLAIDGTINNTTGASQ